MYFYSSASNCSIFLEVTAFGFICQIHGNFTACQAAEDLLCSIMTSIQTKTITLNQPGVARFLVYGEGVPILKEMEQKFEVHISLEKVHWEPLENEVTRSSFHGLVPATCGMSNKRGYTHGST